MKFVRVLHRVFAFLVLPVLGYLLGATIFTHFYDQIETGNLGDTEFIAVAKSCERHGPVTTRGFGFWWECRVQVTRPAAGLVKTFTTKGFLKPEDIGRQVAVETTRRGRDIVPQARTHSALGMVLLFPFGVLWVFVLAWTANPLLKRHLERVKSEPRPREPDPEEPISEVYVWGRRKKWLRGTGLWLVIAVSFWLAAQVSNSAFRGPNYVGLTYFVVGSSVLALILLNLLRRVLFAPSVVITAEGLVCRKKRFSWAQVDHVRMDGGKLVIQPHQGPAMTSRRFGDSQVVEIHEGMRLFSPVPCYRDDLAPAPAL